MNQPMATIVAAVLTSLLSGVVAALVSNFLNRKKSDAETEKIRTETEKLRWEIKTLTEAVSYNLPQAKEQVIFDGTNGVDGFDIKGWPGNTWKDNVAVGAKGEGELRFDEGGVINVKRTNTDGRYELTLQRYTYAGRDYHLLPKNESIGGKRKLRIRCEAKAIGGEHTLRFIVRDPASGKRLADDWKRVKENDWIPIEIFLQADPSTDCQVRIDDDSVSHAPSSVQLRNLVVAERL
jgi:hypothetical protein